MPWKKGGGGHLEFFDETNGQYDEETKARIKEEDKKALALVHYFKLPYNELVFHFPQYGLHDSEYCKMFVDFAKEEIRDLHIEEGKISYLLTYQKQNDKSAFLALLGYDLRNPRKLLVDICTNTDIGSLTYSRFKNGYLLCQAKTTLGGKLVTSIWELKRDFILYLVTIIPGGDKKWK